MPVRWHRNAKEQRRTQKSKRAHRKKTKARRDAVPGAGMPAPSAPHGANTLVHRRAACGHEHIIVCPRRDPGDPHTAA